MLEQRRGILKMSKKHYVNVSKYSARQLAMFRFGRALYASGKSAYSKLNATSFTSLSGKAP